MFQPEAPKVLLPDISRYVYKLLGLCTSSLFAGTRPLQGLSFLSSSLESSLLLNGFFCERHSGWLPSLHPSTSLGSPRNTRYEVMLPRFDTCSTISSPSGLDAGEA